MRKLFLLYIVALNVFAAVPTTQAPDPLFQAKLAGTGQIMGYLKWIAQAGMTAKQVSGLQGLQQLKDGGAAICKLCGPEDMDDLQIWIDKMNGDLCSSFTNIMQSLTGIDKRYSDLQAVQAALQTNPVEAGLALQQASLASQTRTEETMRQMQMMQLQQVQKEALVQKWSKQYTSDYFGGMGGK